MKGKLHDSKMPEGWHTVKSVLLTELATSSNWYLCVKTADALFHARLLAENVAPNATKEQPDECARAIFDKEQGDE